MLQQIFIANSAYALFLYLLRFWKEHEKTLYLLGPSVTDVRLPNRLPMFMPPKKEDLPQMRSLLQQQAFLLLKGRKVPCYGNVETIFSPFFVQNFPFYPISDGIWDIEKFPEYLKDPRFQKMYTVRYAEEMPIQDNRIEYLDLNQLWAERTPDEKRKFLYYFQVEEESLERLEKGKVLLITQPLSEDHIMSEDEKIAVFDSIIKQYGSDNIIIKPHPREWTDYKKYFPNIEVFPKTAPFELLKLVAPKMNKVATFFSTAGINLSDNVDFYSLDFGKLKWMTERQGKNGEYYRPISSFDVEESLKNSVAGQKMNWLRLSNKDFYRD